MTIAFVPCPACDRHVKVIEKTCPFCHTSIEVAAAAPLPRTAMTSRAAILAAGASAILGVAGCSSDDTAPTSDAGPTDASVILDASGPQDATADRPTVQPVYGSPVFRDP
jgi:hypothetical protein